VRRPAAHARLGQNSNALALRVQAACGAGAFRAKARLGLWPR